jgi:hypothetical protein
MFLICKSHSNMSFCYTVDRINTVGELTSKENDGKDSRKTKVN